jgi:TolA-binding protein
MRRAIAAALCLSFLMASVAEAQTRLPRKTRSERQVEDINRSLQQEQRVRGIEQQIQTNNNQIRQSIDRQRTLDNSPSSFRSRCPAGAIGC